MAIKQELRSNIGTVSTYHRIENVEFDFELGMVHIILSSYADASYRQQEKKEMNQNRILIERYHELANKEDLSEAEMAELEGMNICELEAYKIERTAMGNIKYSLPISEDVRPGLYKLITAIIPEMKNGKEI